MEKTFRTLNDLESAGLLLRYAVGGAFALSFYTEPIVTFDMDVFVFVPETSGVLVSLTPIYDFLRGRGCSESKEHVLIAGTPVQFIAAFNPLIQEAVREAVDKSFKAVRVRVVSLEHLMAIMLHTGRGKDFARLAQVMADTAFERPVFEAILKRHNLMAAWDKFQARFL